MLDEWAIVLIAGAAGLVLAVVALTWAPAVLIKRRQVADLHQRCRGKLALTYDDGPGAALTGPLIDLLARYNAKATFFLVGFRALRSPDACDRLLEAGHELGCHTHMHRKPWRVVPWRTASDLNAGYRNMAKWLAGYAPFRPPFGKLTTWSWLAARHRGSPLCWWTFDGCDTHPILPDPADVARRVAASGGAVVLLHSHDRGPERQKYVVELTEQLLNVARQQRWEVCTMSQVQGRTVEPSIAARHLSGAAYGLPQ